MVPHMETITTPRWGMFTAEGAGSVAKYIFMSRAILGIPITERGCWKATEWVQEQVYRDGFEEVYDTEPRNDIYAFFDGLEKPEVDFVPA